MRLKLKYKNKSVSSLRIIIFGFFGVIMAGTLLLMLPISNRTGGFAPFLDSLFTATSAVCVTGLVVQNTATYWSGFGQAVILILIQIGGLGVVTLAIAIASASGKRIGIKQRSTMQESISAPQMGGIVPMVKFILKSVALIEGLGALALTTVFCPKFGFFKGIWYSIFHAISAFCNAGFDVLGTDQAYVSLMDYAANPVLNITIMLLITVGGIGFFTWSDVKVHRLHFSRYRMQSKVILVTSFVLILLPAAYLFFFEFEHLPMKERVLGSLFQSITLRTAGFNSLDLALISEAGLMLMIVMMIIGGSPGSTAGGMKTTTAAVLFASAISVFRQRNNTRLFKRRFPAGTERQAAAILLLYVLLFVSGGMIISRVDDVPLMTALFETASAIGTVGLSLGITPALSEISRIVLISLMFFGRVGGLTLIFATVTGERNLFSRYPEEKITVG